MVSFDEASLAAAAGVNPWTLEGRLEKGDPAQIESMAAAFSRASRHYSDAHAEMAKSHTYVKQGFRVQGSSPLDMNAAAQRLVHDPHIGSEHTAQIAKILSGVGSHLDEATTRARHEITTLNSAIRAFVGQATTITHADQHDVTTAQLNSEIEAVFNKAVAAVRSHAHTITGLITHYERTLNNALRGMADLGYIPPDAVDEGPGDLDPSKQNGAGDGRTTISAINNKDHVAGVRQFDTSTRYVDLLNRKMKADGRLNDSEYNYLWQYNNTVDGHLPQIDHWLQSSATHAAVRKIEHIDPNAPETVEGAVHRRGSVIADGVLNLTAAAQEKTDHGAAPYAVGPGGEQLGRGGLSGLPPSLTKWLYMDLGQHVPNDPKIAQDPNHPGTTLRAQWDPKSGQWVIGNQSNADGFTDLLANYSSQDVTGGSDFSTAMGQAGVRWKQELNTISHNTHAYYEAELERYDNDPQYASQMQNAERYAQDGDFKDAAATMKAIGWPSDLPDSPFWKSKFNDVSINPDDTAASNALTVSAHNATGAAHLLLDPTERRAVMGLNWQNGDGAANELVSGTRPSHDPSAATNQAAQAVMRDGGADWKDLSQHLNHPTNGMSTSAATALKNALTTIAVDHVDTFALDNPNQPDSTTQRIVIPGNPPTTLNAVQLSNTDGKNYLELISSLGDKNYGLVETAGLERGAQYLAAAQHAGDGSSSRGYEDAWRLATNLTGHISGAGHAQLADAANAQTKYDAHTFVKAHEQYRQQLADYNSVAGPINDISQFLDVGGSIAGFVPGSEPVTAGLGYAQQGLGLISGVLQPPDNPMDDPKYLQAAFEDVKNVGEAAQGGTSGFGSQLQSAHWMAARALELTGHANDAPGVFQNGHIMLPTGFEAPGSQNIPGITGNASEDAKTQLEGLTFPDKASYVDPAANGSSAYAVYYAPGGATGFQPSYGQSASTDPDATGSWGDGTFQTQTMYGDGSRINWDYGTDAQQKAQAQHTSNPGLPHPLLTQDTSTGNDDPRTSVIDNPRDK